MNVVPTIRINERWSIVRIQRSDWDDVDIPGMAVLDTDRSIFFDPVRNEGFKVCYGMRLAATSYGEFGDDADNARRNFEAWLDMARTIVRPYC